MEEFKLTEKFKEKGYIHCNSLEEYNDMIKWFKNNSIIANTEYDYNNLYSMNLYGTEIFDCDYFKYNNNKPLSGGFYIIEWTDHMSTDNKTFTKDMLKDGMVVECVNGVRYLKLNNNFINNGYMPLDRYNEDLTLKGSDDYGYTVNKIYKSINVPYISELFDDEYLELIWKRKEEKPLELTMEDIESQYGCKVKIVNK